jgi:hypothetical protein
MTCGCDRLKGGAFAVCHTFAMAQQVSDASSLPLMMLRASLSIVVDSKGFKPGGDTPDECAGHQGKRTGAPLPPTKIISGVCHRCFDSSPLLELRRAVRRACFSGTLAGASGWPFCHPCLLSSRHVQRTVTAQHFNDSAHSFSAQERCNLSKQMPYDLRYPPVPRFNRCQADDCKQWPVGSPTTVFWHNNNRSRWTINRAAESTSRAHVGVAHKV